MDDAAAGVVERQQRVGGGRAHGRLLAGPQHAVDEPWHNGRVETVLEKDTKQKKLLIATNNEKHF